MPNELISLLEICGTRDPFTSQCSANHVLFNMAYKNSFDKSFALIQAVRWIRMAGRLSPSIKAILKPLPVQGRSIAITMSPFWSKYCSNPVGSGQYLLSSQLIYPCIKLYPPTIFIPTSAYPALGKGYPTSTSACFFSGSFIHPFSFESNAPNISINCDSFEIYPMYRWCDNFTLF